MNDQDKILNALALAKGHIIYAEDLVEGSDTIPPPPLPVPDPEPDTPIWDITRPIGVVAVGSKQAGVVFPHEWGKTALGKPKIKMWEWFRDFPPIGLETNINRDRYIFAPGQHVFVYLDGSNWLKSRGRYAYPGPGAASHAWEVLPGQVCRYNNKHLVYSSSQIVKMRLIETPNHAVIPHRIFLFARLCVTQIPTRILDRINLQ